MSRRIVYLNGRFVPERQARISIYDSGLLSGEMVFDSTRTFAGQPFELSAHLERLLTSLEILEMDCGRSPEELKSHTLETLERNRATESAEMEWQIVHNISAGIAEPFLAAFPSEQGPTVCISCWPLLPQLARIAPYYKQGVRLVVPQQRAMPPWLIDPRAKTRSRVHARFAQLQAAKIEPGAWPLLLDEKGSLAEGPSWNLFLVKDGRLITPTTRNVLPGVSRSLTLKMAESLGIPAEETDLTPNDAQIADEIFCTATSFCVLPVASFNGKTIGSERPGPITRRLSLAWQNRVGVDFIAQAKRYAEGLDAWKKKEPSAPK